MTSGDPVRLEAAEVFWRLSGSATWGPPFFVSGGCRIGLTAVQHDRDQLAALFGGQRVSGDEFSKVLASACDPVVTPQFGDLLRGCAVLDGISQPLTWPGSNRGSRKASARREEPRSLAKSLLGKQRAGHPGGVRPFLNRPRA